MRKILQEIEIRQKEFAKLPFFIFLEQGNCLEDAIIFVSGLAFFVLTFQDILRINESKILAPELLPIVQHHRQEDLGHDEWFLHDIDQLGTECNAFLLFGKQYIETRDASFEIVSEIFRASDDRIRLVIPLVLEASGRVFFSRVHKFFSRTGYNGKLKYFSKEHFQVELNHELFEQDINERLLSIQLTDDLRKEAIEVIDRIFTALSKICCDLYDKIRKNKQARCGSSSYF